MIYNNSEFFYMGASNESIYLIKVGWYKVNIRFIWTGLTAPETYNLLLWKNGVGVDIFEHLVSASIADYNVKTFGFIYSDGDDIIWFNCIGTASSNFLISSGFHQASLEYVGGA